MSKTGSYIGGHTIIHLRQPASPQSKRQRKERSASEPLTEEQRELRESQHAIRKEALREVKEVKRKAKQEREKLAGATRRKLDRKQRLEDLEFELGVILRAKSHSDRRNRISRLGVRLRRMSRIADAEGLRAHELWQTAKAELEGEGE